MEYVRAGCVSLMALVFAASALSKLRDFGASSTPIAPRHLARNATLLIAAALGGAAPNGLPMTPGLAVAVAGGLVGAVLIVVFDDIVDLFARSS